MMPYLCSRAISLRMSPLRLIGAGRLLLFAGLLSNVVSCTSNSVLIPMSNRCRAKMSGNSTKSVSTASLASRSRVEFVQSKLDRNFCRESLSFGGLNCSTFSISRNSFRIHV